MKQEILGSVGLETNCPLFYCSVGTMLKSKHADVKLSKFGHQVNSDTHLQTV